MTEPSAKIIADSVSPYNDRVTTMEVVMHRFVLAEFNTHRVFSRNSASSRAIPVAKQLQRVTEDPAWPLVWPAEQAGMQGGEPLAGDDLDDARDLFKDAHADVLLIVNGYLKAHQDRRLHKSLINRLLEPFMWHTVVVTSTEWENFFAQRCSPLAMPEIRVVADRMREALYASTPMRLAEDEWHLPYLDLETNADIDGASDTDAMYTARCCAVSAARCARVSYLTHDGRRDWREDVELYRRLVTADPPHWSPLEHVCGPAAPGVTVLGNFTGFVQLRHAQHHAALDRLG